MENTETDQVSSTPKILQLKITLAGSKPPIWRRFLVEDSITFHRLHNIIQIVMGWENYHLYMFQVNGTEISVPHPDDMFEAMNSKKTRLKDILSEKQRFGYVYDFGDDWKHVIVVEKVLEKDKPQKCPVCTDGKRNCPPEDCGGVWGYEELLEIKKDKNHPQYEEMIVDWLGEDFAPEKFDLDEINKSLVIFFKRKT